MATTAEDVASPGKDFVLKIFINFPEEIRRKIWELNLPGPRLVEVVYDNNHNQYGYRAELIVNMGVCREARAWALEIYPLSFSVGCDAPPLILFNFERDCLLLGRRLDNKHIVFRRDCDKAQLGRVRELMVDVHLNWNNRTKDNRGHHLCDLSWCAFNGLKEYTALYTGTTDPLPFWAEESWFPKLSYRSRRIPANNPRWLVEGLKKYWHRKDFIPRLNLRSEATERFRFGGISECIKWDPQIRRWSIPKIYSIGVKKETINEFDSTPTGIGWAMLLMDRAIDDIFD